MQQSFTLIAIEIGPFEQFYRSPFVISLLRVSIGQFFRIAKLFVTGPEIAEFIEIFAGINQTIPLTGKTYNRINIRALYQFLNLLTGLQQVITILFVFTIEREEHHRTTQIHHRFTIYTTHVDKTELGLLLTTDFGQILCWFFACRIDQPKIELIRNQHLLIGGPTRHTIQRGSSRMIVIDIIERIGNICSQTSMFQRFRIDRIPR